jgi:hypothetical protein
MKDHTATFYQLKPVRRSVQFVIAEFYYTISYPFLTKERSLEDAAEV